MISTATLQELADYAAAGRIGDRGDRAHERSASRNGVIGAWVFGLTVFLLFAVTTFHGCQRQIPVQQSGHETVARQQRPPLSKPALERKDQASSRRPDRALLLREEQVVVPTPERRAVLPADPSNPAMWRDPRSYGGSATQNPAVKNDLNRTSTSIANHPS